MDVMWIANPISPLAGSRLLRRAEIYTMIARIGGSETSNFRGLGKNEICFLGGLSDTSGGVSLSSMYGDFCKQAKAMQV